MASIFKLILKSAFLAAQITAAIETLYPQPADAKGVTKYIATQSTYYRGNFFSIVRIPSTGRYGYAWNNSILQLANLDTAYNARFTPEGVENISYIGSEVVAIVRGSTSRCKIRYELVTMEPSVGRGGGYFPGDCGKPYTVVSNDHTVAFYEESSKTPSLIYNGRGHFVDPREVGNSNAFGNTNNSGGDYVPTLVAILGGLVVEEAFLNSADATHDCMTSAIAHGLVQTVNENILEAGVTDLLKSENAPAELKASQLVGVAEFLQTASTEGLSEASSEYAIQSAVNAEFPNDPFKVSVALNSLFYYKTCVE